MLICNNYFTMQKLVLCHVKWRHVAMRGWGGGGDPNETLLRAPRSPGPGGRSTPGQILRILNALLPVMILTKSWKLNSTIAFWCFFRNVVLNQATWIFLHPNPHPRNAGSAHMTPPSPRRNLLKHTVTSSCNLYREHTVVFKTLKGWPETDNKTRTQSPS